LADGIFTKQIFSLASVNAATALLLGRDIPHAHAQTRSWSCSPEADLLECVSSIGLSVRAEAYPTKFLQSPNCDKMSGQSLDRRAQPNLLVNSIRFCFPMLI